MEILFLLCVDERKEVTSHLTKLRSDCITVLLYRDNFKPARSLMKPEIIVIFFWIDYNTYPLDYMSLHI